MEKLISLIHKLNLFDAEWYLTHNQDVVHANLHPWSHFCNHGLMEGRQPGPRFDPVLYTQANPDIQQSSLNPLVHYLQYGYHEGRPLTPSEKEWKLKTGSRWPESPIPTVLPKWFGGFPREADNVPASVPFRVLYGLSIQSGGTPQTNQDLMNGLSDLLKDDIECFVLYCNRVFIVLYLYLNDIYIPLERYQLDREIDAFPHRSSDFDKKIKEWLYNYSINLVHIRHSAWQSLGLTEIAYEKDLPIVYSIHDYYTVCPTVKLLDNQGRFCAGRCSSSQGECEPELWRSNQILPLKHASIYEWQRQFAEVLSLCSAFVTTIDSVRKVITSIFPAIGGDKFTVIPHGRNFESLNQLAIYPEANKIFRVLVPGHIVLSKGADVLCSLANMRELSNVEWHVLGTMSPDWRLRMPENVILHNRYNRDEFGQHVAKIRPNIGAVLSIWPETWCHTLTELWSVGVPVVGFNIGAVGQRITETGAGWAVSDISAEKIKDAILKAQEANNWKLAFESVIEWQENGQIHVIDMASDYWRLYKSLSRIKA